MVSITIVSAVRVAGLIWVLTMHYDHTINGFQFTCLCGGEAGWGNIVSPIKDFINKLFVSLETSLKYHNEKWFDRKNGNQMVECK